MVYIIVHLFLPLKICIKCLNYGVNFHAMFLIISCLHNRHSDRSSDNVVMVVLFVCLFLFVFVFVFLLCMYVCELIMIKRGSYNEQITELHKSKNVCK